MASHISSLLFCFLLPYFGFSEHTPGRSHHVLLHPSSVEPRPQKTLSSSLAASDCSALLSGPINDKMLPLVHPLSPCSHRSGSRKDMPSSVKDILRADELRLRSLHKTGTRSSAASTTSDSIPVAGGTGSYGDDEFPGTTLLYTVVVGYGTPPQQFAVAIDTAAGFSFLRCKPCKAGDDDSPCEQAFDPSLSSSFAPIPCGSPECGAGAAAESSCSTAGTCPFRFGAGINGTFVKDILTLSPSAAAAATVDGFTFACTQFVDDDPAPLFFRAAGMIDLSRDNRSLASRVVSSSSSSSSSSPSGGNGGDDGDGAVAFSYCLPSNQSSHGFLSISPSRSKYSGRRDVQYAPLVDDKDSAFYFVELAGIKVGGVDLQIPPSAPISKFTMVDTATTFSYFSPAVYAVLRDEFRRQMAEYPTAPPLKNDGGGVLDTCYNFTGLDQLNVAVFVPIVGLEFAGGASLEVLLDQMMYFADPANRFSVACLAFAETNNTSPLSVIGNQAQQSVEMIYDLQEGKLGFAQGVC